LRDGKNVDEIVLERFVGKAYVADFFGTVGRDDAQRILEDARKADPESAKRILVKGKSTLSFEGAEVFAEAETYLYGNESQTVGPENAPMAVHKLLLSKEVVLLEGVRLSGVPEGVYMLFSAPINLAGAEGAPCRAVLVAE
jgi:arylformamidase